MRDRLMALGERTVKYWRPKCDYGCLRLQNHGSRYPCKGFCIVDNVGTRTRTDSGQALPSAWYPNLGRAWIGHTVNVNRQRPGVGQVDQWRGDLRKDATS